MIVKLLTNLGSMEFPGHPYREGEEHEVEQPFGERLVKRKLAMDITPPPPPVAVVEPVVEDVPQVIAAVDPEPELKAVPEENTPSKPKKKDKE